MLRIEPRPDFTRFLDTLLLRRAYRRPPMFDFHVALAHKERLLGRPLKTPGDDADFFFRAGYDYVQCTVHVFSQELVRVAEQEKLHGVSMGSNLNLISSLQEFRAQRWSWQDAADGDLSALQPRFEWLSELRSILRPGVKIILHGADVFTYAWQLIGFEQFCLKSYEEPELIAAVMESLASAQLNAMRRAVDIAGDTLGAVFYSDDIAYTTGLMLSPEFFRTYLIPVLRRFAGLGSPLIYHSDGRLYDLLDDFHAAGVRGIQPLEPKSMDPLRIKTDWPGKMCLMGNIDLDLMSRGGVDEVEAHVRERLDRLMLGGPYKGGYMPGVSNTVPYYVSFDNYCRMIEVVHSMPDGEF
mgnify:CR=1 FL=1